MQQPIDTFRPTYNYQPLSESPVRYSGLEYHVNGRQARIPDPMQATFRVPFVDGGREIRLFVKRDEDVGDICEKLACENSWFRDYLLKKKINADSVCLFHNGMMLDIASTAEQLDLFYIHRAVEVHILSDETGDNKTVI
jgi:hypothetical protein